MDAQKAFEIIGELSFDHAESGDIEIVEALDIAGKALEKQIAKKPLFQFKHKDGTRFYDCPVCTTFITRSAETYCSVCGQRLDWSEV